MKTIADALALYEQLLPETKMKGFFLVSSLVACKQLMHEGNYSKNIEARVTRFSFLLVANMARIKRQKHPDRSLKIFSVTVIILKHFRLRKQKLMDATLIETFHSVFTNICSGRVQILDHSNAIAINMVYCTVHRTLSIQNPVIVWYTVLLYSSSGCHLDRPLNMQWVAATLRRCRQGNKVRETFSPHI